MLKTREILMGLTLFPRLILNKIDCPMWNWRYLNSSKEVYDAFHHCFAFFYYFSTSWVILHKNIPANSWLNLLYHLGWLSYLVTKSNKTEHSSKILGERSSTKGIKEWHGYFMWLLSGRLDTFTIVLFTVTNGFLNILRRPVIWFFCIITSNNYLCST